MKQWLSSFVLDVPRERNLARSLIIEGDCLNAMRQLPDGCIDLILCDLPYGTTQNSWDSVIPLDLLWVEYDRILSAKGAVLLMGQGPFTAQLINSKIKDFKYKLVWIKSKATNFLNAKKQPLRRHEDICVFYRSQPVYNPVMSSGEAYNKGVRKDQLTGSYGDFKPVEVKSKGSRYPSDVFYCKTAESEGTVYHSTQKPVELGRYLIKTYSNEGDLVLDNAFGSGSFLVAAAIENRSSIGIELNQAIQAFKMEPVDLIEVAQSRLQNYISNTAISVCRSVGNNFLKSSIYDFLAQRKRINA
jgi:site-specific DNA-methyltransferase (adenine-specific)